MISLGIALRRTIISQNRPVVTEYEAFLLLRALSRAGEFEGEPIRGKKGPPTKDDLRRRARELRKARYLRPDEDFYPEDLEGFQSRGRPFKVFRVADIPDAAAEDVAALVDPFCYISHLSAMQRLGLTNRTPAELHLTSPETRLWTVLRDQKMAQDYGASLGAESDPAIGMFEERVRLERISLPKKLRGRQIAFHTTKYLAETRSIRGSFARIAAIGDVFVQMLDEPTLCGGMSHAIEVWANEASPYLEDIIKATDRHHSGIVKVRAAYLLETLFDLKDARIDAWQQFAQRGSSRKLDPTRPYLPTYSEKWMLSLNVRSEYLPTRA